MSWRELDDLQFNTVIHVMTGPNLPEYVNSCTDNFWKC